MLLLAALGLRRAASNASSGIFVSTNIVRLAVERRVCGPLNSASSFAVLKVNQYVTLVSCVIVQDPGHRVTHARMQKAISLYRVHCFTLTRRCLPSASRCLDASIVLMCTGIGQLFISMGPCGLSTRTSAQR